MHLEVVELAQGPAIGVRDYLTKTTLWLHFVGLLGKRVPPAPCDISKSSADLIEFSNQCLRVIREQTE